MYKCDIVADSINATGNRLTTFYLMYPRIIHAEMLRHRTMSRSVSSSRAIPVHRMIEQVGNEPYVPTDWRMNERGMQGWSKANTGVADFARQYWLSVRDVTLTVAGSMVELGIHKQHVNRLLEPFAWVEEVVTATEWQNFFSLRTSDDADPAIQTIATMMRDAYVDSEPRQKRVGDWHLPFVRPSEATLPIETQQKISAARCARTSYSLRNGKVSDVESDTALFDRLASHRHWSPLEHVAVAVDEPVRVGNFLGWQQLRKQFYNESGGDYLANKRNRHV